MATSRSVFAQFNAADGRLPDPAFQSATSTGTPTALPNFAQAFTADPTYENFKNLNQQQNTLTNAFGQGNTPFSLQDIQGVTSAFQQAIQPYAQQFQEQSGQEVLAQRMAAQQRMPFDPFMQQAPSIPMKEASGIDSDLAFQDAVKAANPGLNFGDRNPFRMTMDRDIYDQAEDYYRQYGTGLPQFQQPATQTRALDPQNSNPNSAASQLSAFLAGINNSPTGSMLGTLPVPPAAQPLLQNAPQTLGGFGQMPNLSQMLGGPQPSVPTAPTAPTAPTSFGSSAFGQAGGAFPSTPGNYGGGASGGMALEGRYGIASGNSTPFPIQGNVSVVKLAQGGDVSKARQMLQRFADGGDVSSGLKYATGEGGIGADKYYENIRNFFANAPDEAATRAAMAEYGVSEADIKRATGRPLAEMFAPARQGLDAGALASELGIPTFQVANLLNQGLDASAIRNRYAIPVSVATDLMQRSMTGGVDTSEFDRLGGYERVKAVYDAAGGSYTPPFGQKPVTQPPAILPPTQPLPPLTEEFVAPTAPLPQAPPVALTPGQEGLDPGTAIVGAIPKEERVTIPQLDTEFRASAPRTAIYDRFGRITGYNYSPAAKLTPATGTNVFNFVPPGITSRPRSLLNLGDVPGVTVDPVTGQLTMPLSASQRFARDRAELDNQFRRLYARAAEADTSLPTQAPATAAAAFRQFAMNDPTMSAQLRMRDIEQTPTVNPTAAMTAARSEFGAAPYAAALTAAFDPFLARNKAALLASKDMQRSYFERYPDLVAEYEKNWSKTMSPEEYAAYHYRTLGQKEGRTPPNLMGSPYTQQFFSKGGEASTEDFIKKQSGGDVSRETASPNAAEVPKLTSEGQLIDEREEIRSESQRMLNRLQSQPSKLPPGLRRTVAATREQGKESMFPAAAPARDLLSGILGASPTAPGSEAYRTGQAIANMPPVQAAAAIPAKIAASAGDAATALAAMGPAMGAVVKRKGGNWLANAISDEMQNLKVTRFDNDPVAVYEDMKRVYTPEVMSRLSPETLQQVKEGFAALKPQVAINKWIDTKLAKYMQNEFATPEDPVRALIERGISPARNPDHINPIYDYNNVFEKRKEAGFPVEGLAETEAGRNWEEMADSSINVSYLKNLLSSLKERQESKYGMIRNEANRTLRDNPWLNKLTLPYTPIYGQLGANHRPVFNHVIDELQNAMATNSGLPKNLQLDPDDLSKMNVPQVVEFVDKINKWRVDNIKNLQLEETLKADLYKAYPEQKYRWVQLNRPGQFAAESDAMGHSVRGYEPPDKGGSDYYGLGGFKAIQSGEAKIYSLRDEKGQPHVTIEVASDPTAPRHADIIDEMKRSGLDPKSMDATSYEDAYDAAQKAVEERQPSRILQIKGKGNGAPAEKYLPFIQDFVKSGNWSQVNDLRNAGLAKIGNKYLTTEEYKSLIEPAVRYLEQSPALEPHRRAQREFDDYQNTQTGVARSSKFLDLRNRAGKLVHPDIPYTYREMISIFRDPEAYGPDSLGENLERVNLLRQLYGEEGFAHGGSVNVPRETSTSKQQLDKLAQVSQRKKA